MLNRFRTFAVMLLVATIFWGVLFYQSIQEWRKYVKDYYERCEIERQRVLEEHGLRVYFGLPTLYWAWNGGGVILLSGCVLLCSWIVSALVKKKAQILVSVVVGFTIAFGFLMAARVPSIGYTVEHSMGWGDHPSYRLTLNPLLHLGGGTVSLWRYPMGYAISSSILPRNLLLYLLYGELSSFSIVAIFTMMKKRLSECSSTRCKRLYLELKKTKIPLLVIFLFVTAIPAIAVLTGLAYILVFVIQNGGNLQIELFHSEAILYFSSGDGGWGVTYNFFLVGGAFVPSFLMCLVLARRTGILCSGKSLKEYVKSHKFDLAVIVIGGIVAGITVYCDIVSLYDKPLSVRHRILCEGRKPRGMSILPPKGYYFNPPGGSLESLSLLDRFSLFYPIVYFVFLTIETIRYHRWKTKQDNMEKTWQNQAYA